MTTLLNVHQFTAVYSERDAIGQHTYTIDSILREMGCRTTLFAEHAKRFADVNVKSIRHHHRYPNPDIIIYQMSIGSPVADYILTRPEPVILNYHNITPHSIFQPWAPAVAEALLRAREQLYDLAQQAHAAIADSNFNALELHQLGMSNVDVVPVLWKQPLHRNGLLEGHNDDPSLLFVGRIAPNKCIEHLISSVALLKRKWHKITLSIVGTATPLSYETALRSFAHRLNVSDSIKFLGSISNAARDSLYTSSTLYVNASIHEGFCVPLIEAMSTGLPIVARASTAVPETVGDAGVLVCSPNPLYFATAIDRILSSPGLRKQLTIKGHKRAEDFSPALVKEKMKGVLQSHFGTIL